MGCSASIAGKSKVGTTPEPCLSHHRTLSDLDMVSASVVPIDAGVVKERSLLMTLNQQQLMDLLNRTNEDRVNPGRRFSISSETDKEMHRRVSFSSKETQHQGDHLDLSHECIGYACKKGLKPESPNQDSFFICKIEGAYSIYGVFDGHGRKGHDVSDFVKENLPKILVGSDLALSDPIGALEQAFSKTQKLIEQATGIQTIDARRSGTTVSVILHHHKHQTLYTAHVGDSRCVLAKHDPFDDSVPRKWLALDLTEDHKPNLPAEKARIEKLGGEVIFDGGFNYRVYAKGKRYPGLNMSRAMGDLVGFYDAGISATPDINQTVLCRAVTSVTSSEASPRSIEDANRDFNFLSEDRATSLGSGSDAVSCGPSVSSHSIDPSTDKFLLLCSDGVWEFVSSEEAVTCVGDYRAKDSMKAAEQLASMSWDRWQYMMQGQVVDDITALVIHLDRPNF